MNKKAAPINFKKKAYKLYLILTILFVAVTGMALYILNTNTNDIALGQNQGQTVDRTLANYLLILIAVAAISAAGVLVMAINNFVLKFADALAELSDKSSSFNILESVLNGMDIFLYVTDSQTDEILFVNKSLMEHLNLTGSVIGKQCWKVFQQGYTERCDYCSLNKLLKNPEEPIVWEAVNTITGRYYRNIDRLITWPDGKVVHFCQRIDMNEAKQAQDMLLRMSSIVQSSPYFIAYKNFTGECLFVNPEASNLTGYSKEELMEDYIGLLFDEETAERLKTDIPAEIKKEGKLSYELAIKRKDGEKRFFSVSSFLIGSEDAFATVAIDITEKVQFENKMLEALEKAEYASRAKGDFLSRMSHEIRTPMNAIIGMVGIAKKSKDLEGVQECLKKIGFSAEQLIGIINDILDMSKIEAGKMELSETVFQLRDVLDQVNAVMNSKFHEKRQVFLANIAEGTPEFIQADKQKLAQVITNLLSNANKFTPVGGNISLCIQKIESMENRCRLLFEVEDDGIGIPKEQQGRIFSAFEQADNSITRQYGGTGLGLAISQSIVNMMNGEIWISSEQGKGCIFKFTINAGIGVDDKSHHQDVKIVEEDIINIFAGKRILLADDIAINRDILIALLEDTGIAAESAENGREACEKFSANPEIYDMIFMDIHMPEMDGYAATRSIRKMKVPKAGTVPIIAMTADVFSEDVSKCLDAGMNDHVGKPLNIDVVISMMKHYLLS